MRERKEFEGSTGNRSEAKQTSLVFTATEHLTLDGLAIDDEARVHHHAHLGAHRLFLIRGHLLHEPRVEVRSRRHPKDRHRHLVRERQVVQQPHRFEGVEERRQQRDRRFVVRHPRQLRQDELHADDEEAVEHGVHDRHGALRFAVQRFLDGRPVLLSQLVELLAAGLAQEVRVVDGGGAVRLEADVLEALVHDGVEEGLEVEHDDVARHFGDQFRGGLLLLYEQGNDDLRGGLAGVADVQAQRGGETLHAELGVLEGFLEHRRGDVQGGEAVRLRWSGCGRRRVVASVPGDLVVEFDVLRFGFLQAKLRLELLTALLPLLAFSLSRVHGRL